MKKTKTKCYLYTRVSTSMQVDGYSLDAQRDKLRKYAEYEDMVVAGEYSDEGFSGKNIQGRHEFQRMLQDIQDCKDGVEYVLVFKLSRFGRNAADVLNSLQLMQDFGVNLICVEDGIDSSKDSGKLMISVLSAVAEIERENIRTQTMAGREQKAREGKWNGGFAPYGYRLEKGELLIAEDEVDVIRTIFDRYIHTNDGVSGVAKYLNRQGFVKKLRQNGTIPGFSASFVKSIIDNPVYMGKIAYGRRRTEKKIGTRNEMHVVEQSEFPVYEGKHEAIISEEDWNLAQEKRKINAYRREKVNDPTHAHILSGILKCPCCGKSLYGNIAKAHSKDKKTRYYYYCKNTVTPTGHECTFRLNIEQMEMNRMVASIISAMVSDPRFADAIKAKIGSAVDTNDLEKQLEALQAQLRQTLGTKARLERQMDGLDVNDPYYDRKISDLQRRYDEQYGAIDEIEVQIDDVQSQIRSIRQEKISGDNIYRLLLAFDQVYEAASEVERKEFMRAFIERIELFPEKQPDGNWIRKIIFNFPVPVNGTEVKELPLENETIVDNILLLSQPGMTVGDSFADVLLGRAYPSGKMAATWAAWNDYAEISEFGNREDTRYREGIYVGYRWFDTVGTKPLFPFGFGLGYTTFMLTVGAVSITKTVASISVTVENTGSFAGKEVVQLYVSLPQGKLDQPKHVLASFVKTEELQPGETQAVTLSFDMADLLSYDATTCSRILERGEYILWVGNSSRNTVLAGKIMLERTVTLEKVTPVAGETDFTDWKPMCGDRTVKECAVLTVDPDDFTEKSFVCPSPDDDAMCIAKKLTDEELCYLCTGEFENEGSKQVIGDSALTVAGAAGESTGRFRHLGVQSIIMADGPAGLRLARECGRDENGVFPRTPPTDLRVLELIPEDMKKVLLATLSGFKKEERSGETYYQNCTAIPVVAFQKE